MDASLDDLDSTPGTTLRGGEPEVRWLSADEIPPGYWFRDDHRPFPVTPLYADFDLGKHIPRGREIARAEFSGLAAPMQSAVIEGYAYNGVEVSTYTPSADRLAAFEAKVHERHEERVLARWHTIERPRVFAELTRFRESEPHLMSDGDLLEQIRELSDGLVSWYGHHFTNTRAAGLVIDRARIFCRERLEISDDEFLGLLAGSSPATTAAALALRSLAGQVDQNQRLSRALSSERPLEDRTVQTLLRPFLELHGYRTSDFDYTTPALAEQPERAVALLQFELARLRQQPPASPEIDVQVSAGLEQVAARLAGESERQEFRRLLDEARSAYGVRDDDIGLCLTGAGLMRRALLESGQRLASKSIVTVPDHVLYLRRSELESALAGATDDLRQHAEARLNERQSQLRGPTPPFRFGTPPPDPAATLSLSEVARLTLASLKPWYRAPENEASAPLGLTRLQGIPASRGRYSGPARIIGNEDEFGRIQPGDALVCRITTPTWNIAFGTIGAMFVETGSVVSHAAIAARELGLPAVVGVRDATRILVDGEIVVVDGSAGSIWH